MTNKNYFIWDQNKEYSKSCFNDYNLIMPDISVGNVGQLAIDLLLNNLKVTSIGRICHPCFVPFVGDDPFHPGKPRLVTSCEIYECQENKLVIIQIRSGIFSGKKLEYINLLIDFIKDYHFKLTILTSSSFAEYFAAEQLYNIPLHYLCTSVFPSEGDLKSLNFKEFSLPDNVDKEYISHIPGSFIAHRLLEKCKEESISLVALICICSEGNNYPEAIAMVNSINSWLKLKEEAGSTDIWEMPISWKMPYGNAAPYAIY